MKVSAQLEISELSPPGTSKFIPGCMWRIRVFGTVVLWSPLQHHRLEPSVFVSGTPLNSQAKD